MAPTESFGEAIPDGLPSTPPASEDGGRAAEPNGHGDGRHDSSIDQHALLQAMQAMRLGDFSVRLPGDQTGLSGKIADTFNEIVAANQRMANQLAHVGHVVGRDGKIRQRARFGLSDGAWGEMESSVNTLIDDLLWPTTAVTHAIAAVAQDDLLQTVRLDVDGRRLKGEFLRSANIVNTMIKQLSVFTSEVTRVAREVGTDGKLGGQAQVREVSGVWKDLTESVNSMASNLTAQVRNIAEVATAVTKGDLTRSIQVEARGEVAALKDNINTMIDNLRLTTDRNTEQDWLKTNLARFTNMLQGQRDLATVGSMLLSELAPLVNAQNGVIYSAEGETGLRLLSAFADDREPQGHLEYVRMGQGLVGQCAADARRMLITQFPKEVVPITSGMFRAAPKNVIVLPVLFEGQVKAVIELASLGAFTNLQISFLDQLSASIGFVLNSIEATMQTEGLLTQSQQLATELQTQQRELQQTNDQLEQKAQQLEERNIEVERKNQEIEQARRALEEKASELALASKYKSDFLANMSHELRTPLNSILILGQQLGDNPDHNLTPKQVEFARMIHSAGTDLMNLISDILDLSKIESGTVTVDAEEVFFVTLQDMVIRPFRHEAESRHLFFDVEIDPKLDRSMITDSKRLQQVLKNLLSNAFKFTEQGGVKLSIRPAISGWTPDQPVLRSAPGVVAFEVSDTGIGIPPEKQKIIFEAFQQADASTNRRFGGTGLGLAISRELSHLLGGELQLRSASGIGSTFTLYLPLKYVGPPLASPATFSAVSTPATATSLAAIRLPEVPDERLPDDRAILEPGDTILLIVEDDPRYARILADLAHDAGFKVLTAMRGADALALAREYQPTAISLDVFLPDMLGWTVLSQLKQDQLTRHIPVQIVTLDEDRQHGLARGAFSFVTKPSKTRDLETAIGRIKDYVQPRRRRLLVVEDNPAERLGISELLGHDDIDVVTADTGAKALKALREQQIDCTVLDLRLPDMSGFELLELVRDDPALSDLPVIVFTAKELSSDEDAQLHKIARSVVVKGVESPERLLDETALFLHRVVGELPQEKQKMLERLHNSDEDLGKTVLLGDDDAPNIFALSSVLERRGMTVLTATTGNEAIALVESTQGIAIVLMDIMMLEMDGYQTMQVIRANPAFRRLPIIALTAKAMNGDRERCLEAGASDYLAKPVNTEQMLAALRMWLHR